MIPSESAVRRVLEKYHPVLAEASRAAMSRWMGLAPAERIALGDHPRTYANAIWAFFRAEATTRLTWLPGVALTNKYNTFGIVVNNRVMLRFKRINKAGQSRNFPTQLNLRFYAQVEIPGIPASCPRAELGWREDALRVGLEALEIVMRNGREVAWRYTILNEGGATVVPAPIMKSNAPRKTRIIGRGIAAERKRKDGGKGA